VRKKGGKHPGLRLALGTETGGKPGVSAQEATRSKEGKISNVLKRASGRKQRSLVCKKKEAKALMHQKNRSLNTVINADESVKGPESGRRKKKIPDPGLHPSKRDPPPRQINKNNGKKGKGRFFTPGLY